jgi:hypothetical protein
MSYMHRVATTMLLLTPVALGCGTGGSATPPTPEQAASTPPLETPKAENAAGFSAPVEQPK